MLTPFSKHRTDVMGDARSPPFGAQLSWNEQRQMGYRIAWRHTLRHPLSQRVNGAVHGGVFLVTSSISKSSILFPPGRHLIQRMWVINQRIMALVRLYTDIALCTATQWRVQTRCEVHKRAEVYGGVLGERVSE